MNEAFAIFTTRKDGGVPKWEKASRRMNGEMPLVWDRQEEAEKVCRWMNGELPSGMRDVYKVFKISISIEGSL